MDMESKAAGVGAGNADGAGGDGGAEVGAADLKKSANAPRKGADAAQSAAGRKGSSANRQASDDEILGLDLGVRGRAGSLGEGVEAGAGRGAAKSVDEILFGDEGAEEGEAGDENRGSDSNRETSEEQASAQDELTPEARAAMEAHPELSRIVEEAAAYRGIFPSVEAAREVAGIFPDAGAARAARQQVAELSQIDALFSANRPEAHAELAAAIQRLNPEAFQSLSRMMRAVAEAGTARSGGHADGASEAGRGARGARAEQGSGGNTEQSATNSVAESSDDLRGAEQSQREVETAQAAQAARAVNQGAQRAFFHEANASAVEGVLGAIRKQVDRLMPDEISESARKRVVGDIYRELGGVLESTAGFSDRVRQVFGAGRLDGRTRDAVVRVIVDQARQSIPGVAKKVINEWTTSVVGKSRAKTARQKAAAARVDIAGGGAGAEGRKSLMPKDIDYRRLSDADILNL
jgi:hypothetical protein